MRKAAVIALCTVLPLLLVPPVSADAAGRTGMRVMQGGNESGNGLYIDPSRMDLLSAAQVDTFCIVWYDFEQMDWQGWTREDNTAQHDTFWHVDHFQGLGHGGIYPLEGIQSMWCGTRIDPFDPYLGSWKTFGYGDDWEQYLVTDPFLFTGPITLSFKWYGDFYHLMGNPGDGMVVEYAVDDSECPGSWVEIAEFCLGPGCWYSTGDVTLEIPPLPQVRTKLRFRVISDDICSGQTGWNTWGQRGAVVDSITISDAIGVIDFEDFESAPFGAGEADGDANGLYWRADVPTPYGMYSGLMPNLADKDPCNDNYATQIVFFIDSWEPSAEYPGFFNTPYCWCGGGTDRPCQDEMVVSPVIDLTKYSTNRDENQDADIPSAALPDLGGYRLEFGVYRDLPVRNLVFYTWQVRNIYDPGYYGPWYNFDYLYYSPDREYYQHTEEIGSFVFEDAIQVSLNCIDMCWAWYDVYGDCVTHTPAPWFDNVRIHAYDNTGPQWSYNDIDLFQDNFPSVEYDIESTVRADAARDILPYDDPNIEPDDCIKVRCTSPKCAGGIKYTDDWPEVYMHVKCTYIGPAPAKPDLSEDNGDPLDLGIACGRMLTTGDHPWTIFQASPDESYEETYRFDLNDELFTRGYMIEYYFSANDDCGLSSTLPRYAHTYADFTYPSVSGGEYKGVSYIFEFTCLPTLNSDILFVDDVHGRGSFWGQSEDYWNNAFVSVIPGDNWPDRYDVNGPTQFAGNGLGSRARTAHLSEAYKKIIWDSGDLSYGTITDGSSFTDKSPDCQLLVDWLDNTDHDVGLWVCGNGVAYDLDDLITGGSGCAATLMNDRCGVDLYNDSYFGATGGLISGGTTSPLVTGTTGGVFYHIGTPDEWIAFGGCPAVKDFDILTAIGPGFTAALYPAIPATAPAAIQTAELNGLGYIARTMWFGFSFMYIRDPESQTPSMRNHIVKDVIEYLENPTNSYISGMTVPAVSGLTQNYPNPFNPTTTISYDVACRGLVRIGIYTVDGRLVRMIVDEVKDAGRYTVVWNGTDGRGLRTASGVYFCRMECPGFERTRKMVLLR
jgi:hypothetical protein